MLSTSLVSQLRALPRTDKLRALQVLANDLAREEFGQPARESHHLPDVDEPLPPALENDEPSLAYRAFVTSLRGKGRKDDFAAAEG